MSFELALAHLKVEYPGQLVLYCRDLARILSRSELSVSRLLDRGQLPFKVKKVGRERCVDIFQVAAWLTAGADEEKIPPKKPTVSGRVEPFGGKEEAAQAASLTPMMAQILQQRHDAPMELARLAALLVDVDERSFMIEVAQELMFSQAPLASHFVVTFLQQVPVDSGLSRAEEKCYFDTRVSADAYVNKLKSRAPDDGMARITMKQRRTLLQHLSYVRGGWLDLL